MSVLYRLVGGGGEDSSLSVFLPTGPKVVRADNPMFDEVLDAVRDGAGSDYVESLIEDATRAVRAKFATLSERVSVREGRVYFDGDEVDSTITQHILRFLEDGVDDWQPLVAFLENLAGNPTPHTQHRLYGWLQSTGGFTITEDGCFIAYKGLRDDLTSIHSGPAVVDGRPVNGNVPNEVGSTVEFSRSEVQHNPAVGCSTGLHAGTWDYASSFGSRVVRVKVNPRDVVSVPTDCNSEKLRTCRYEVLAEVTASGASEAPVLVEDEYGLGD